jgi:acetolactate synthase-1/2/3 large subunit
VRVAEAVGRVIAALGTDPAHRDVSGQHGVDRAAAPLLAFGLTGSGNFHVTNGLIAGGARYVAARHEGGAAMMADAWARSTGRVGLLSLHQGPGLTNAMTGITEAAKSRTPLLVLVAEAPERRSNFYLDVAGLAAAVGAMHERLRSPATAIADAARAYRTALGRRTVVLSLPLDVQAAQCDLTEPPPAPVTFPPAPSRQAVHELASALLSARRPIFIAGRGARPYGAGEHGPRARALEKLANSCGALLATSAAAKGLFTGNPWNLDVSGGFASPLAAELIASADLIVAWGCTLNMWTTRHGSLIGPRTTVIQVDDDPAPLMMSIAGINRPARFGVLGDVTQTAIAVIAELANGGREPRSVMREKELSHEVRWRNVPFEDESDGERIDPRTLSIVLDDLLPAERTVAVDSGNFMGYPSMFMSVPDEAGFCFTQAFQSVGLGLASAIGAALARPDRLTVAALGDGGALMGISELETLVRLEIPMVVIVYDDEAYGAEVHHFGPYGDPLDTVRFPPADIAAIGRGFGCEGVTVRRVEDLAAVRGWLDGPRSRPLVIDAKVTAGRGSWWLEEAFRGH